MWLLAWSTSFHERSSSSLTARVITTSAQKTLIKTYECNNKYKYDREASFQQLHSLVQRSSLRLETLVGPRLQPTLQRCRAVTGCCAAAARIQLIQVEPVGMAVVIFILHVFIITVQFWSHVHHLKLNLSLLKGTQWARSEGQDGDGVFRARPWMNYLLGQNGDRLFVFGISQVHSVDGKDGVTYVQTSTSLCGLTHMNLWNQDGDTMLFTTLVSRNRRGDSLKWMWRHSSPDEPITESVNQSDDIMTKVIDIQL